MTEKQKPTLEELQNKQDEKLNKVKSIRNSYDDYKDKESYKKDFKEAWDEFTDAFAKRAGFEIAYNLHVKTLKRLK